MSKFVDAPSLGIQVLLLKRLGHFLEQVNPGWITPYLWATVSSFTHFPKTKSWERFQVMKFISAEHVLFGRSFCYVIDDLIIWNTIWMMCFFCYIANIFFPQGGFVCFLFTLRFNPTGTSKNWTPLNASIGSGRPGHWKHDPSGVGWLARSGISPILMVNIVLTYLLMGHKIRKKPPRMMRKSHLFIGF